MILEQVKTKINKLVGKNCHFVYRGSRNQNDVFDGVIVKTFPSVFLVTTVDGINKSYSYNDVLISVLQIIN